jgi:lipopolysaccharide/colanic/teichoic acid biosynthesis glycosyltransferase
LGLTACADSNPLDGRRQPRFGTAFAVRSLAIGCDGRHVPSNHARADCHNSPFFADRIATVARHAGADRKDSERSMTRRLLDILLGASGLIVLSPMLLIIAGLIRLDDGGPALFTQLRLGRYRRPFLIYKFRTMRDGAVTDPGRWLRATGLDELPQLWNLVRGEMSLIGPRPLTADDVERLGWDRPSHRLRWRIRPGIAGLAQIHAGRGARLSWFLDCRYVRDRSLGIDIDIVVLTAAMSILGKRRIRAWLRRRRRSERLRAASRSPRARAESGYEHAHTAVALRPSRS